MDKDVLGPKHGYDQAFRLASTARRKTLRNAEDRPYLTPLAKRFGVLQPKDAS